MSPLTASNAIQTTSSATSTWHVGISPVFPPSLTLTSDAAIESLLADIPFLSVGLLGFGVLSFFCVMRKVNRLSLHVFLSTIVAFLAGVLDVSQVITRGRLATDLDTNVSLVLPLLVTREIALSISVGIRLLFFWTFVSQPPRGELRRLPTNNSWSQRLNFLQMESEIDLHSGNWMRLGYVGGVLKYSLLLAVLVVPVLQILWRVVAVLSKIGPVYDADSSLEVALSALFVMKLFTNAWLSPLTPRWKTIRDYSPVIAALFIGLGIGIGNMLQFQFSETSLGRFFQAVQLYILILYVLVTSFYERRTRTSIFGLTMEDSINNPITDVGGIETRDRMSILQMDPAATSASRGAAGDIMPHPETLYPRPNHRLSSWLNPETKPLPVIQGTSRRLSLRDRLSSLISGKRNSAGQDRTQPLLGTSRDVDSSTLPGDTETSFVATMPASQRLERSTMALDASSSGLRNTISPDGAITSFSATEGYSRGDLTPLKLPKVSRSPVYGLDGIMSYHGQPSPLSRPSSTQSSSMKPLLRQQAELVKSVAELQLFSPISSTTDDRLLVPEGQLSSIRSDFSLSIFPDSPDLSVDKDISDPSEINGPDDTRTQKTMSSSPMTTKFQVSQSAARRGRRHSFVSSLSSGTNAIAPRVSSRTILGSGGYDVTSFIGSLTSPLMVSISQANKSRRLNSFVIESYDAQDVTAAKTRLSGVPSSVVLQAKAPPLAVIPEVQATPRKPFRRMKQGLPSSVKLNISGPISQPSAERSLAYERPRAVPPTT